MSTALQHCGNSSVIQTVYCIIHLSLFVFCFDNGGPVRWLRMRTTTTCRRFAVISHFWGWGGVCVSGSLTLRRISSRCLWRKVTNHQHIHRGARKLSQPVRPRSHTAYTHQPPYANAINTKGTRHDTARQRHLPTRSRSLH